MDRHRACLAIAVLMFVLAPASAETSGGPGKPILQLEQYADGDRHYFFHGNAMMFALRTLPKNKKYDLDTFDLVSNVVVYAERRD